MGLGCNSSVITVLIWVLMATSSIGANGPSSCVQNCGSGGKRRHRHRSSVPYPFGFSDGCRIRLNCSDAGKITIGKFHVRNLTGESILVNLPAKCHQPVHEIKPLFGENHALTWRNNLMMQKCSTSPGGCVFQATTVEKRLGLPSCGHAGEGNIGCYSEDYRGIDVMGYENLTGSSCEYLFTSIAVEITNNSDKNTAVPLQFQAVELGWWLDGPCKCSRNADCTRVMLPKNTSGFRCRCKAGFVGDGFADGGGCRKAPHCTASRYMSGHCGGSSRLAVLIVGIISGALLVAGLVTSCYFIRRRSNSLKSRTSAKRLLYEAAGSPSVPLYPYKEIERATNGFSLKHRLGTGAYGTVYAGKFHNDEWVAIKKIRHRDNDGIEQVMNEIKLLSSVSHPNLVRLLGCCIENNEQILVYEYMPNGTLSQHLQKERGNGLPWTIRLTVAAETAHAIAYLHSAIDPPIYHRDIKSSNILLDYNYNSKVADFGLSRLGMTDDSHISTAPQGTPGYLDPQYHQNFHLSDKSDVYSFGVVLVEIITALKVVDFSRSHSEVNLAALAIDRIGSGRIDDIVDPFLEPNRDAWTLSSIHKVAELAFRCLAFHRDMRPSMMEVAEELEQVRLSGWAPLDENICMGSSSVGSSCSSPYGGSEKSFGGLSLKRVAAGSKRLVVPPRGAECLASVREVTDRSPVSVRDPWPSEQSSPSTNSLLGKAAQ